MMRFPLCVLLSREAVLMLHFPAPYSTPGLPHELVAVASVHPGGEGSKHVICYECAPL
jgi:hypothetical protein